MWHPQTQHLLYVKKLFDLDDVDEAMFEQAEFWNDATKEDNLDQVRDIPDSPPADLDEGMIYDIQQTVGRLAEKAPQLIGKSLYNTEHLWQNWCRF